MMVSTKGNGENVVPGIHSTNMKQSATGLGSRPAPE